MARRPLGLRADLSAGIRIFKEKLEVRLHWPGMAGVGVFIFQSSCNKVHRLGALKHLLS